MQFTKCLELSYKHNYFADPATANLFSFNLLPQSRLRLRDLQLQFTATDNGGFIAAPVEYDDTGKLVYITPVNENTRLSFAVYTTAPYFFNITQMPDIKPGEQVFYLAAEAGDQVELCFGDNKVYPLEQKGILVYNSKFCVTSESLDLSVTSQTGGQGNPLFPDPKLNYLDISHWPDALYKVSKTLGHTPVNNFFGDKVFVCRELIASPPLMFLDCLLPGNAEPGCHINLRFSSRAVYWQYQIERTCQDPQIDEVVIDSTSAYFTGLRIPAPSRPVFEPALSEFERGKVLLALEQKKGAAPDVFISSDKSALTQAPWLGVSLKPVAGGGGEPVIENLPNPNIELIYRSEGSNNVTAGEYYASIKVNI